MTIKFAFLTGDLNWQDYGGSWISQKFNNSEFDWWFVRALMNWEDSCGEDAAKANGKYNVTLSVVAPSQVEDTKAVLSCYGETAVWEDLPDAQKVEMAHTYGAHARVFESNGDNYSKLFKEVQEAAQQNEFLFGFAMDKQQNAIGASGWDFIKGQIVPSSA